MKLLLSMLMLVPALSAQQLILNQAVTSELSFGKADMFTLEMAAGQFAHLVVIKNGVDATITVTDSKGKLVVSSLGIGTTGKVFASLVATAAEIFQVKVQLDRGTTSGGKYSIALVDLRPPNKDDFTRIEAERAFSAALLAGTQPASWRQAVELYKQAAELWHALNERQQEAVCLHRMGAAYFGHNEDQKVIEYSQQALTLYQSLGNRVGESSVLHNIGLAHKSSWDNTNAVKYYQKALDVFREIGDSSGSYRVLNSMAILYKGIGERQKSLRYYEQILKLALPRGIEASILNNAGNLYMDLGDFPKALEYCTKALEIRQAIGNEEVYSLISLGEVHGYLGEFQKALDFETKALTLSRTGRSLSLEAKSLTILATIYSKMRDYPRATEAFLEVLPLWRKLGHPHGEAETLNNLGEIYLNLKDYDKALPSFAAAHPLAVFLVDPGFQGKVLSNLMLYWEAQQNHNAAIFFGKEAVNQYQQSRTNIKGIDADLQFRYLNTFSQTYRKLADILITQGRLSEAEQVLALLKDQEYFQYVRRAAEEEPAVSRRATLNSRETEADKILRAPTPNLIAIGTERGTLLGKMSRSPEEIERLEQLEKLLSAGNTKFEQVLLNLGASLNAKTIQRVEQFREEQGIMEDLRELPPGTVAIYTLVGDNQFTAILRTPDAQKAYSFPIKAADFNRKVLQFRQVVMNPKLDPHPLGRELFKIILAGMETDLRHAKAKTLMFSLDGVMRYLPLAALFDGKQYLLERYRISVMTLASQARIKDKPDSQWRGSGFGVTKAFEGAPALPSVAAELTGIIATKAGDNGALSGEIMLDEQFTQKTMRQALLKRNPVVHIASHFRFQPGDETQSFLLLGDGSHLSLAELKTSANLFGGVQLLTLSACNTGLGDGTEVEGFGVVAQRQGAKAVIASLWPVADSSTSLLMRELYRVRESSAGKTKLEALQTAQLGLLHGTLIVDKPDQARDLIHEPAKPAKPVGPPYTADPKAPYAHPYYWAPFFLMGNWL